MIDGSHFTIRNGGGDYRILSEFIASVSQVRDVIWQMSLFLAATPRSRPAPLMTLKATGNKKVSTSSASVRLLCACAVTNVPSARPNNTCFLCRLFPSSYLQNVRISIWVSLIFKIYTEFLFLRPDLCLASFILISFSHSLFL